MEKMLLLALLLTMVLSMQAQTGKGMQETHFSWSGGIKAVERIGVSNIVSDNSRIESTPKDTDWIYNVNGVRACSQENSPVFGVYVVKGKKFKK